MIMGLSYVQKKMYEEGISELQKAKDNPDSRALLGYGYAVAGKRSEAQNILEELQRLSKRKYVASAPVAIIYIGLGEKDKALERLEKAYDERLWEMAMLKVNPVFDPLRSDPRFAVLLRRVGFTPYFVAPAPSPNEKSIAVLPFANLSSEPENAYFADGVQEEILTRLAKIGTLKVISRTSTQRYKSTPDNLLEIAKQLGVAHILEGTVQKAGNRVRVNVQLINAQTDSHLWADKYDRKLTDIFAVESEISKTIVETLQAKLTGAEQYAIAARPTTSTAAHQLYLKGRFFWNKRTGDDLKKALDYFNQAVAADPQYALPYAGIADVYLLLPNYSGIAPKDCLPKAEAAAKKALELDDTLAEAHNSLAYVLAQRLEFAQAEKEFKRAIELNPNYATAHQWYSDSVLIPTERMPEGLAEVKRALEVDPLSPIINAELALAYDAVDRYDDAIEQFHRTIELEPGFYKAHLWLGNALEVHGDLAAAIVEYRKAAEVSDDPGIPAGLASAYAALGNTKKAVKILDQLQERAKHQYVPAAIFAMLHLALGNKDEAMRWLEKSYQDGAGIDLQGIRLDRRMARLHGDPRFEKFVSRILPPRVIPVETTSIPEKSIAVLSFENLSSEPDNAYFADGIQEEILTRLAKIGTLKVISRTSTQKYKSAPENLSEIAKQLGVANFLEGSVQKAGNQVRVNVQLIRAQDASHLWAETYDRNLNDIFSVESQIATKIADTLKAKLTGFEQKALATRSTENPEAHQLYLYGRYFWNKRTGTDLQKAIGYFKQAIEKDPQYALAYAGLADSYVILPGFGGASPGESLPLAKTAAQKALELDDTLAEAHSSLGLVLICYDFDLAGSMKEFERAIELNPNYATAHQWFGNQTLLLSGDFDRAIAEAKLAVELDPLSLIINAGLGIDYFVARRYDEAIEQLRKTLEIDPRFYYAHWILGEALEMKGQLPEALKEYKKAAELDNDPAVLGFIAKAEAKMGQRDEALKILAQLQQLASQRYVSDYTFALVHMALGENENAIDWLERAYEHRAGPDITFIKLDPMLDPLRSHLRFESLAAQVLRRR